MSWLEDTPKGGVHGRSRGAGAGRTGVGLGCGGRICGLEGLGGGGMRSCVVIHLRALGRLSSEIGSASEGSSITSIVPLASPVNDSSNPLSPSLSFRTMGDDTVGTHSISLGESFFRDVDGAAWLCRTSLLLFLDNGCFLTGKACRPEEVRPKARLAPADRSANACLRFFSIWCFFSCAWSLMLLTTFLIMSAS